MNPVRLFARIHSAFFCLVFIFLCSSARADVFYEAEPDNVAPWAHQGMFHFIRIDGGKIESLKAERTWWGREFSEPEKEVLSNVYGKYSDKLIELLKEAGFNWVWLTWSNGWSNSDEAENRNLIRELIPRLHGEGIRVTAYMSASNMFWESTLRDEPESITWVLIEGGRPVNYGGPDNPMRFLADVRNPDWRSYIIGKAKDAMDAGVDAIFFDNLLGDTNAIQYLFSQVQSVAEKKAENENRPKIMLYGNAHLKPSNLAVNDRCELIWNEFGKSTPGVWEDSGWYVTNARKIRFIQGAKHPWQPHKYEMDKYYCGPREKCFPGPAGQKLSIAEAWAFGSSLSRNIEGRFLYALMTDDPAATAAWDAISDYNNFISGHSKFFTDMQPAAKVALLSQFHRLVRFGQVTDTSLGEWLIKRNIMYGYKIIDRLEAGMPLESYNLLLVPGPLAELTEEEESILEEYIGSGGTIATLVKEEADPELAAGHVSFGDKIVAVPLSEEDISRIGTGEPVPDLENRIMKLSGEPLVEVENGEYLVANLMKKRDCENFALHILNYDHNTPANDVKVKFHPGNLTGSRPSSCKVLLVSPDSQNMESFDAEVEGGTCSFDAGDIVHYTIAAITVK